MASENVPRVYGIPAATSSIPQSWSTSQLPKPMNSRLQEYVVSSASGAANVNGNFTIQVPTGAAAPCIMKKNSVYLKGKLSVTVNGDTGVKGIYYKGAGSSSLLRDQTWTIGSTVVSSINHAHKLYDNLLYHTSTTSYTENDATIYTNYNHQVFPQIVNAGNSAQVPFIVPIIFPLQNETGVPLFLLNAPLQLSVNLESIANAFLVTNDVITNYTLSDAQLVYEANVVDQDYIMELKQKMLATGANYTLNMVDYNILEAQSGPAFSYQMGLKLSSCLGILFTSYARAQTATAPRNYLKDGLSRMEMFIDGRLVNQVADSGATPICFANLNKALSNLFDTQSCSSLAYYDQFSAAAVLDSIDCYENKRFCCGVGLNRVNEGAMTFTGTPVSNMLLNLTGGNANNNVVIIVVYNSLLLIDAMGNVQVAK